MDMVTRQKAILLAITILLGMVVLAHAEVEENEPERDEASVTSERQEDSDERTNGKEKDDEQEEEAEAMSESKKDAAEQEETYTRLPVQTRINPNQNVALPQDI